MIVFPRHLTPLLSGDNSWTSKRNADKFSLHQQSKLTSYIRLACRIPKLIQMHACLTGLPWPAKGNNQNIINVLKRQHFTNAKRATPFKCHVFLVHLLKHHPCSPAPCAQEAFPFAEVTEGASKTTLLV